MKHIFLIVSFFLPFAANLFADTPPNVLIILADDMGYWHFKRSYWPGVQQWEFELARPLSKKGKQASWLTACRRAPVAWVTMGKLLHLPRTNQPSSKPKR